MVLAVKHQAQKEDIHTSQYAVKMLFLDHNSYELLQSDQGCLQL